jgi:hypothetical protein
VHAAVGGVIYAGATAELRAFAEVSELHATRRARSACEKAKPAQRPLLGPEGPANVSLVSVCLRAAHWVLN